ncbi:hypothetical protein A2454_05810 [Candidatus Peribacteria bacterium RIFOXYC2_FULL_55_14]|nr:MAG: hypothetical protein A2198_04365 [Candidatus Peribacteria bacterium RIFOXYA1_FULL_56_14]OGJ74090.1 MAG: hypothetical protein A2217_00385 [Candidatus Peribacteria bacterium RIFOXYA2_FULL_55_28]OGJ75521.1 MAG: hypothetical protein A2384_01345 [Candidatus Peribacteria bacterium RIFOXYB1_FULL_54_35]OGJ76303.1 MAG: hypothetical protein A2327_00525 [Candidatus Peribacteria bacterium RIFOXYB2_FULL_54_17]OGJ78836.1 MAG: hypothetical protein A2424_05910 [Candidatus Peribacteria bacterium RIFOXYC
MTNFFKHGGPPRTQREFAKAAMDCIEGGAYTHATILIEKIRNGDVRRELLVLLDAKKSQPVAKRRR